MTGGDALYVALLRGINVGGKNKMEMSRIKMLFSDLGFERVSTYINSGNVVFSASSRESAAAIEDALEREFGFRVRVLVREAERIVAIAESIPRDWVNDSTMRCDVMFLWDEVDHLAVLGELAIKEGIDEVIYVPGAVIWRVDRANVTRSGMSRVVGTDLYKAITIRNCNTARKLAEMVRQTAETG